ncbi:MULTISPECIES: beta-1,6-N-acetylglucosaminyltransferase [Massilia]|uniref:Peptide O-xylosyltransferase n=1 Tax=Massilia haematophila TaxID=457923 RepID=A0ABV7PDZ6_9BURK|nr:beta-1,6-N-acetylglucosaminyltransferase [Massilia sp.]
MRQVFLIHAHKDLEQLNDLVAQLCDPDFAVYVHLDRKWRLDTNLVHPLAQQVEPRIDVRWGGFSQVQAMLGSLRRVLAAEPDFDKLVFLSAQDFPVLSNSGLKRELARLEGRELIEAAPVGPHGWQVAFRYQYFHREGGGRAARYACALLNRALRLAGRTRRMPGALAPWGGSAWWSLSRACIAELLAECDRRPALPRFFRSVLCPDEMFFHTLLMNSRFRDRVLANHFRYVQWPQGGGRNPAVLTESDVERILASGAHFCRKLDSAASAGLRAQLLAHQAREGSEGPRASGVP